MPFHDFFIWGPPPENALTGHYDYFLVGVSFMIAVIGSFVALDIAAKLRNTDRAPGSKVIFLLAGAITMALGIWTMHFIGMEAFDMHMPMYYDALTTFISFTFAAFGSGLAFYLIKEPKLNESKLIVGGIFIALAIVLMHYIGMYAMNGMIIRYIPSYFFLSIVIAIVASETALWLMIKGSSLKRRYKVVFKVISAIIMGFGIGSMHYMGMTAAVFLPLPGHEHAANDPSAINVYMLSMLLALTFLFIILIAMVASHIWVSTLKASEKRLSEILAAAADGILVVNDLGNIEICNHSSRNILGYDNKELVGKPITNFIGKYDTPIQNVKFEDLISPSEGLNEFVALRPDQTLIPIELTAASSTTNGLRSYIFVMHDLTKRKKVEQELNQLNRQLIEAARKAGVAEVAVGVLHNVGNVLNSVNVSAQNILNRHDHIDLEGIQKILEILIDKKKDAKDDQKMAIIPDYLREFINHLKDESSYFKRELEGLCGKIDHLKHIVKMQQMYSKTEGGHIEPVNMNLVLEEVLNIFADKISKENITIIREYAELKTIHVDTTKIMQILINLLKNAIESVVSSKKENKQIILKTTAKETQFVQIDISDNGIGFQKENFTKIFSFGFTTKKEGHGYGLHTSAVAAQQEGGSLTASSPGPNQGATFSLILPVGIQNQLRKVYE